MTDTKPEILRNLLASYAKLEGSLQDALAVAGEHRSEVEPILKKVQSILAQLENGVAGAKDNAI